MPGMTANISFQIEAKENVLRVPAAALRFVPLPRRSGRKTGTTWTTVPTDKPEADAHSLGQRKGRAGPQPPAPHRLGAGWRRCCGPCRSRSA